MNDPIDLYCERTGPDFWAEPVNLFSNLAFVLVAWLLWQRSARVADKRTMIDTQGSVLLLMIGVGSALFHGFATAWSQVADVLPVWLFVGWATSIAVYSLCARRWLCTSVLLVLVVLLSLWIFDLTSARLISLKGADLAFNGSLQYLPAVLVLILLLLYLQWRQHPGRRWFWWAFVLIMLALLARSVDLAVCGQFATGTHFLWHGLTATALGALIVGLGRLSSVAARA